jgi:hypothetical protein
MDIFFQDPTEIPLPPEEVRIRQFRAEPWPDNRRVRVTLEITPFQKRPDAEVKITNPQGEAAASLTIIETIDHRMEFTMHLRGQELSGEYTAAASVYYNEEEPPGKDKDGEQEKTPVPLPAKITVVDAAETRFMIRVEG